MKGKYLFAIAALCSMALSLAGCMTSTVTPLPTAAPETTAVATQTITPAVTGSPGAKAALPAQLDELESAAEDIMDDADSGDWAKAQQKVDTIKKDLAALEPVFQSAGVSSSLIDGIKTPLASLEQQVGAKNALEVKVQANQITKVIPDIYDSFQVAMPTDLGRLDYLGREVALNAQKGDWTAAASSMGEIENVWARLKPNLNSTAQQSAADFESSVNALASDVGKQDANAVSTDSTALLDKVDVLEKAYG